MSSQSSLLVSQASGKQSEAGTNNKKARKLFEDEEVQEVEKRLVSWRVEDAYADDEEDALKRMPTQEEPEEEEDDDDPSVPQDQKEGEVGLKQKLQVGLQKTKGAIVDGYHSFRATTMKQKYEKVKQSEFGQTMGRATDKSVAVIKAGSLAALAALKVGSHKVSCFVKEKSEQLKQKQRQKQSLSNQPRRGDSEEYTSSHQQTSPLSRSQRLLH